MEYDFILKEHNSEFEHPNVAILKVKLGSRKMVVGGASIGGGLAKIFRIHDEKVDLSISSHDDLEKVFQHRPVYGMLGGERYGYPINSSLD